MAGATIPRMAAVGLAVLASGCSLTGMFEERAGCEPGEGRVGACGLCGAGVGVWRCGDDGRWESVSCRISIDRDGDGLPNAGCDDLPGGCCTGRRDCNDESADPEGGEGECVFSGGPGSGPEAEGCRLPCGAEGTRTCTAGCTWSVCEAPADGCNRLDDDCDGATDEDAGCLPGELVACATACGSAGMGRCDGECLPPGAAACPVPGESCNGSDDDCDGLIDEGFACSAGSRTLCWTVCGSQGLGVCGADCVPPDPAACLPPGDSCNGSDDDCDGEIDEGFPCPAGSEVSCSTACGAAGRGVCGEDCSLPGPESCPPPLESCDNGLDDDCDGETDELDPEQCRPGEAVACRTACDPVGSATGDGVCGDDCRPPAGAACVSPPEVCNGRDDDCDGETDEGFPCVSGSETDCVSACGGVGRGLCSAACERPTGAACAPTAEVCNGSDDDCDGLCDDGFSCCRGAAVPCLTGCGTIGSGACSDACGMPGAAACTAPAEACNGRDDDCDGGTDEGFGCARGAATSCTTACGSTGTGTCGADCVLPVGAACTPPAEGCNGVDDDCDGVADDGFECRAGRPAPCRTTCGSVGTGPCSAACARALPAACTPPVEVCNGVDDDCDGRTDEGLLCGDEALADYRGVWGASPDDVWAVGEEGRALHWDGVAWTPRATGVTGGLYGVHGRTADDIWAVGEAGVALHWDGHLWASRSAGLPPVGFRAVWAEAADRVWVAGPNSSVCRWDGGGWSCRVLGSGTAYLSLWAGGGGDDVWAGGQSGFLYHWDGVAWTAVPGGGNDQYPGMHGSGGADLWVVRSGSDGGWARRYDGRGWSAFYLGWNPLAVWTRSPTDAWVVGSGLARWNGTRWQDQDSTVRGNALWGWSGGRVRVVGDDGRIRLWDGDRLGPVTGGIVSTYGLLMHGTAADNLWVADGGVVTRRGPDGLWTRNSDAVGPGARTARALFVRAADDVWLQTDYNAVWRWTGAVWTAVAVPPSVVLRGLWFRTASEGWVTGDDGLLLRWNGTALVATPSGSTADLHAAAGISASDAWAVGDAGTVLHWDGASWTAVPSGTTRALRAVLAVTGTDAWAVGDAGTVLRWNGTTWAAVAAGTTVALEAVQATAAGEVWITGETVASRWTGSAFVSLPVATGDVRRAVVLPGGELWAVSRSSEGRVMRWRGE